MPCKAEPLANPFSFSSSHSVVLVTYAPRRLIVHVCGVGSEPTVVVEFERVVAYRVTDEGNLMEFWPVCSTPNGWLFEVGGGGWLSQEVARPDGRLIGEVRGLREFFVTGDDDCVSVLSLAQPKIAALQPQ